MNLLHGLSALAAEMPLLGTETKEEATRGAIAAAAGLHPAMHPCGSSASSTMDHHRASSLAALPSSAATHAAMSLHPTMHLRASSAQKRLSDAVDYEAFAVAPPMIPPAATGGSAAAIDEGELIHLELEDRARRRSFCLLAQQRAHHCLGAAPAAVLPPSSIYDGHHHRQSLGPMAAYDLLAAAGYPTPSSSSQSPWCTSSLAALPSSASSTEALGRAADEAWARVSWLARKERMMIQERMYRDELAQRAAVRAAAFASTLQVPHRHHRHHHQQSQLRPPQPQVTPYASAATVGEATLPDGLAVEDLATISKQSQAITAASDSSYPLHAAVCQDPSTTPAADDEPAASSVIESKETEHHQPNTMPLFLPSDPNFLTEAQCFLRSKCIEILVSDESHLRAPGKGARPGRVGQVGFRCIHCRDIPRYRKANQAMAYPSTRSNILESVRNFQRVHFNACPYTPQEIKVTFAGIIKRGHSPRRSQRLVRAYCAQAAADVGLIDTPHGIEYSEADDYRKRAGGLPSEGMMSIIQAAKEEGALGPHRAGAGDRGSLLRASSREASAGDGDGDAPPPVNKEVKCGKFRTVASEETRRVVEEARAHATPFVRPSDFANVSDYIYLLFHKLIPCRPTRATVKRRRLDPDQLNCVTGMCCRYCSKDDSINGMYFPLNVDSLGDSSFSQTLGLHFSTCSHVPEEVARALEELKALGKEHNACVRRGSKKAFMEKVWGRMKDIASGDRRKATEDDEDATVKR